MHHRPLFSSFSSSCAFSQHSPSDPTDLVADQPVFPCASFYPVFPCASFHPVSPIVSLWFNHLAVVVQLSRQPSPQAAFDECVAPALAGACGRHPTSRKPPRTTSGEATACQARPQRSECTRKATPTAPEAPVRAHASGTGLRLRPCQPSCARLPRQQWRHPRTRPQ